MNIFIKYLLKSTFSKKGRSLLLIVTITISAALLIGSLGAVVAGSNATKEQAKRSSGDYNAVITAKTTNETPFFYKNKIVKDGFDNFVAGISATGYLSNDDNVNIVIQGVASEDYNKLPNMKILKEDKLNPLVVDKIIISEKISKAYNYQLGDTIKVNVREKNKSFKIAAIAQTNGNFSTDLKNQFTVVTNEKNVCNIWGVNGISNTMLVKLKNNIDSNKFIKSYNEKNSESLATLTFDKDKASADDEQVTSLFYFMLLLVTFMSSFIIYSCFKLIVIERMPVVGTFLSQGETRGGLIRLLLGESLVYGIISGILSLFLGGGLLYLLADILNNYKQYGVTTKADYNIGYFIVGFIFAIGMSLISALIPVLDIRRVQIKDIILNRINVSYKKSYKLSVFGIILALITIMINSINSSISANLSPITFLLFFIGAIISLPGITKILSYYLMKVFENFNILFKLALNNIRTSKVLLTNIRLIVIGMVSVMVILSLSSSFTKVLLGVTKGYNFDIEVTQGTDPDSAKIKSVIYKNSNINKEVVETYSVGDGSVKGSNGTIPIVGINPRTFKDFNNYYGISNKDQFYKELDKKDSNTAITDKQAKVLNKSKGDSIVLKINNKEVEYKITGIFNAKFSENLILINKENMIKDFGITIPYDYSFQTNGNVNEVEKSLKKELKGTSAKVLTFAEKLKETSDDVKMLITTLLFFSLMTVIIGTFGIINNIGVSFIQRKKDLAVLSSVGMTNIGNGMMILIESMFTAIFAIGFGGIISYFAVAISNNLAKSIGLSIPMEYDFKAFLIVSIGICIIMGLSSCSAVFKSTKLSVIKELKCE
ncbi:ABC transporter permease [Clostridium estertheticum]|uniref:ABC transporter permease n=1 Tax=Clostridium estertheticum TaxID=238834 RepID=UPI00124EDA1F|nr:FtsX-like permease family protein [Clostridium estertheticum]MBZ9618485.1 ABC transporter permease [Clostridium estertheticum subsp. laramiense]WAG76280.1 ABC transporter permease [Clostridium estertheticum]